MAEILVFKFDAGRALERPAIGGKHGRRRAPSDNAALSNNGLAVMAMEEGD